MINKKLIDEADREFRELLAAEGLSSGEEAETIRMHDNHLRHSYRKLDAIASNRLFRIAYMAMDIKATKSRAKNFKPISARDQVAHHAEGVTDLIKRIRALSKDAEARRRLLECRKSIPRTAPRGTSRPEERSKINRARAKKRRRLAIDAH
jgi:DNA-binding CsgD family transcriptional regulator